MPGCPICHVPLRTVRQRDGIFYHCDRCDGRAVTIPQVRRVAGDRLATQLLRRINSAPNATLRPCPFCQRRMRQFQIPDPPLTLDSCRTCGAVWFDPGEFEAIPESGVEPVEQVQMRSSEALAIYKAEQMAERARKEDPYPEESWKWLPGLLGMPVELDAPALSRWPLVAWTVSALILLASVLAFSNLDGAIEDFGLIPAQFWRYGGLTFLTSFFLHGGVLHLADNLYFFLIFGDNVEDFLGRWRFPLLLLAATLAGDLVHLLADPRATAPCIGASGGISGVIAFYALKYPRTRLGLMFRLWFYFRWLQMPAWGAFGLWLALQFIGVAEQVSGFGNVSALAHLGGVAAGVAAWVLWRKS